MRSIWRLSVPVPATRRCSSAWGKRGPENQSRGGAGNACGGWRRAGGWHARCGLPPVAVARLEGGPRQGWCWQRGACQAREEGSTWHARPQATPEEQTCLEAEQAAGRHALLLRILLEPQRWVARDQAQQRALRLCRVQISAGGRAASSRQGGALHMPMRPSWGAGLEPLHRTWHSQPARCPPHPAGRLQAGRGKAPHGSDIKRSQPSFQRLRGPAPAAF